MIIIAVISFVNTKTNGGMTYVKKRQEHLQKKRWTMGR